MSDSVFRFLGAALFFLFIFFLLSLPTLVAWMEALTIVLNGG